MVLQTGRPKIDGFCWRMADDRHYGRCTPFFYYRGEPLCLLGPDCNEFLNKRDLFCDADRGSDHLLQLQLNFVCERLLAEAILHLIHFSLGLILLIFHHAIYQESGSQESIQEYPVCGRDDVDFCLNIEYAAPAMQ